MHKMMAQVVVAAVHHHHHPVALHHPSHPKANHPNLLLIIWEEKITKELLLPKYTLITRVIPNPTRIYMRRVPFLYIWAWKLVAKKEKKKEEKRAIVVVVVVHLYWQDIV